MIISRAICFQGIHADLFKLSQFLNFLEIFALFEFFSALVVKEPPLRVKFGFYIVSRGNGMICNILTLRVSAF